MMTCLFRAQSWMKMQNLATMLMSTENKVTFSTRIKHNLYISKIACRLHLVGYTSAKGFQRQSLVYYPNVLNPSLCGQCSKLSMQVEQVPSSKLRTTSCTDWTVVQFVQYSPNNLNYRSNNMHTMLMKRTPHRYLRYHYYKVICQSVFPSLLIQKVLY